MLRNVKYTVLFSGVTKLGLTNDKEDLKIFMDDGSMICEDEDIQDEEVIGGKLLILAAKFADYKHQGKNSS